MKKLLSIIIAFLWITAAIGQDYKEIKTSELPKKVTEYFTKNFKSYTIDRSAKAMDKGVVKYAVVAESHGRKAVYIFDKNGAFLGRESKMPEKATAKPTTPTTPATQTTPPKK